MRKIISKQEEDKKKKRNQWIVGVILIFIMIFSTLGFSFMGNTTEEPDIKKADYNGFEFIKQGDFWFLSNLNNENLDYLVFRHNPNEVEKSYSLLKYLNEYQNRPLYLFSENREAELEIYTNMNPFVQRIQKACLNNTVYGINRTLNETMIVETDFFCNDENLPLKSCEDNFIIITESNKSEIIQKNNCVFIRGSGENLTKLADEFLFKIFGIEQ